MTNEDEKNQQKIAEYASKKEEISRRSSIQKASVLIYLSGASYLLIDLLNQYDQQTLFNPFSMWCISILTLLILIKEDMEIDRLDRITNLIIVPTDVAYCDTTFSIRVIISRILIWSIFFVLPLIASLFFLQLEGQASIFNIGLLVLEGVCTAILSKRANF